jgi:hypothetical protein
MSPFRVCFGSGIERGKFLLGVPLKNYTNPGLNKDVDIATFYEGENCSNADGLFAMGIIRHIGRIFGSKGKSEPEVLYIINEEEGKELGFREE